MGEENQTFVEGHFTLAPSKTVGLSLFLAKARQERTKEGKHTDGGYANMTTENEIHPTFNCMDGIHLPNECASVEVHTVGCLREGSTQAPRGQPS